MNIFTKVALGLAVCTTLAVPQTKMNQVVYTNSVWDPFTTSPQYQPQIEKQLSAIITYTPFFDSQLAWFKHPAFVYFDSYAIYTNPTRNSATVNAHPEWVLKDASGNNLFIPWGCSGGSCPQFVADVGNPKFVEYTASAILQGILPGYSIFFDDVNMTLDRVTDGNGNKVAPIDPRTGQAMTEAAWESYFGSYMASVKAALRDVAPQAKVIHNAIWWYDQFSSPGIDQEIKSADYILYERGFGDGGLTGGTGFWSLYSMMASGDRIHKLGTHIAYGEYAGASTFIYSMACYFVTTDGQDTIGFTDLTPDKWDANTLRLMNVDLGAPAGIRQRSLGLVRRDFSKGFVLVVEPGAGPMTLIPDRPVIDAYTGQPIGSITLQQRQGGVYLYQ